MVMVDEEVPIASLTSSDGQHAPENQCPPALPPSQILLERTRVRPTGFTDMNSTAQQHPSQAGPYQMNSYGQVFVSGSATAQLGNTYISTDIARSEYDNFLASLCFPEMHSRAEAVTEAHEGTCEWIFEVGESDTNVAAQTLHKWLNNRVTKEAFWVNGKAGSGKSTFVNFMATHQNYLRLLEQATSLEHIVILKHFFWELGTPLQRNMQGAMRYIIWQFFKHEQEAGFSFWKDHIRNFRIQAWSVRMLTSVLQAILDRPETMFGIFLDGLDECSDRDEVIRLCNRMEARANVKLCISSRPERKFELSFTSHPTMTMHQLTHADMKTFVRDELEFRLNNAPHLAGDCQYEVDNLVLELLRKAEGVWIWLRVAVRSLVEGIENLDDRKALALRLQEMPDDIYNLYLHMLKRNAGNGQRYATEAANIFRILLHKSSDGEDGMSLFRMALMLDDQVRRAFLSQHEPSATSFNEICRGIDLMRIQVQIKAHTAYLVDISNQTPPKFGSALGANRDADMLETEAGDDAKLVYLECISANNQEVQFIHKTIGQFLLKSAEGQQILRTSDLSQQALKSSMREADVIQGLISALTGSSRYLKRLTREMADLDGTVLDYNFWKSAENRVMAVVMGKGVVRTFDDWTFALGQERHWGWGDHTVPPAIPHGFLHWCISYRRFAYVERALRDEFRSFDSESLTNMLWLMVEASVDSLLRFKDNEPLLTEKVLINITLLLEAGADPTSFKPWAATLSSGLLLRNPPMMSCAQFCLNLFSLFKINATLALSSCSLMQKHGAKFDLGQLIPKFLRKACINPYKMIPKPLTPASRILGGWRTLMFGDRDIEEYLRLRLSDEEVADDKAYSHFFSELTMENLRACPLVCVEYNRGTGAPMLVIMSEKPTDIQSLADRCESSGSFVVDSPFTQAVQLPEYRGRKLFEGFLNKISPPSSNRIAQAKAAIQNLAAAVEASSAERKARKMPSAGRAEQGAEQHD